MAVKFIWALIGLDVLVVLGILFMDTHTHSDAVGKGLTSAIMIGVGLMILLSVVPLLFSKHPISLWIAGIFAGLPWLLAGAFYASQFVDSKPQERVTMAMFHFPDRKQRAIAQAIEDRDTTQLRLLAKGQNLNVQGREGMTYLQFAARLVNSGEPEANIRESVRILLEEGADPNLSLLDAVSYLSPATLALFFDGGADPNAKDAAQEPILFRAIRSSHYESARLLLRRGANANVLDKEGWTFVMWAAQDQRWTTVRFLLEEASANYTHVAPGGQNLAGVIREARKIASGKEAEISADFPVVVEWLRRQQVNTEP